MTMSDEEQCYIVEQIDKLISLAKAAGVMAAIGTEVEYEVAAAALDKQRKNVLAMDGIEYDY